MQKRLEAGVVGQDGAAEADEAQELLAGYRRIIMRKWEYLIVSSPNEETLNELGEQGWELVAFSPYGKAFLKRLKS